jgi:polysaccharide export outer membrane protein
MMRFKVIGPLGLSVAVVLLAAVGARAEEIAVQPAAGFAAGFSPTEEYRIGPTDVLEITVWLNDEMNQTVTVRHDGRITFRLLGDIPAAGRTPAELSADIAERLREFIRNPRVTVRVAEENSRKILVLGAVSKPGPYRLTGTPRLLEVLTDVGWREEIADISAVTVMRGTGEVLRVNLNALLYQGDLAQNIILRPEDAVFVPPKPGTAEADVVRVMALGEVAKAGVHGFPEGEPITVKKLLLSAGGVSSRAALGRAKVIRTDQSQEPVDLNRLLFDGDMSQDLVLGPGDLLYVPQTASLRVYVLGHVRSAGVVEIPARADGRPRQESLSVLQAIVLAGHEREGAVLSNVKIVRDWPNEPKVMTVNVERLLRQGDVTQNIPLRDGDVVFIPRAFGDVALETYRRILAPIFPTAAAIGTIRGIERGGASSVQSTGFGF